MGENTAIRETRSTYKSDGARKKVGAPTEKCKAIRAKEENPVNPKEEDTDRFEISQNVQTSTQRLTGNCLVVKKTNTDASDVAGDKKEHERHRKKGEEEAEALQDSLHRIAGLSSSRPSTTV